ncbi:unnamed protein product [Prorocentrum cordatum]|uniref:Generative cell specific-1/HAP2 domain-containing protein n=1 Tax=Prorocentrum cordatum TaxID=2364126 RepID=A0ABN9W424_9DINO|nr:unnamed protein product [Polarella glacialis]
MRALAMRGVVPECFLSVPLCVPGVGSGPPECSQRGTRLLFRALLERRRRRTKSPAYWRYPLAYVQEVNNKPTEHVIYTTGLSCRDNPQGPIESLTCGVATKGGEAVVDSEGFCCGCDLNNVFAGTPTRSDLDCPLIPLEALPPTLHPLNIGPLTPHSSLARAAGRRQPGAARAPPAARGCAALRGSAHTSAEAGRDWRFPEILESQVFTLRPQPEADLPPARWIFSACGCKKNEMHRTRVPPSRAVCLLGNSRLSLETVVADEAPDLQTAWNASCIVRSSRIKGRSAQMLEQRALVTKLTEEVEQAAAEHRRLVPAFHVQTARPPEKSVEADGGATSKCTLASILDGSFSEQLSIDPSELLGDIEDYELSSTDQEEMEKRSKQLRDGIQELARTLFAQTQQAHMAHVGRPSKKRRVDDTVNAGSGEDDAAPAAGLEAKAPGADSEGHGSAADPDAEAAGSAPLLARAAKVIQQQPSAQCEQGGLLRDDLFSGKLTCPGASLILKQMVE